jgi:hypothetical protein
MSQRLSPSSRGVTTDRLLVLIAAVLGLTCAGCLILGGVLTRPLRSARGAPTPVFTVVVLPSATPTPLPATATPIDLTPTPGPTLPSGGGQGFAPGDLVQVSGTGGEGLRLRREPSLNADIVVLGLDNEVFRVVSGPTVSDGYTWWQLVNPYDSAKQGWAVDLYLRGLGTTP